MKTILCALYAAGIVLSQLLCMGCATLSAPEADWTLPPEERFQYDPDPSLVEPTQRALTQLAKATGLPFEIVKGTTPVVEATQTDMSGDCAQTLVTYTRLETLSVMISVALAPVDCYEDISLTIEHEIIHSVRRDVRNEVNGGHTASGIFYAHPNPHPDLDAASLDALWVGVETILPPVQR